MVVRSVSVGVAPVAAMQCLHRGWPLPSLDPRGAYRNERMGFELVQAGEAH